MKTFKNLLMIVSVVLFSPLGSAFADGPAVQWEKTFGGSSYEEGRSVQQTSDGGYIIAGWTAPFEGGLTDVYLVKTDAAGNMQWQKTFGGSNSDQGYSVQQTTDGGYIIAGTTYSFGAGWCDLYLIKTDSAGNLSWQKAFGEFDQDYGYSAQQTADGGYIIAGMIYSLRTWGDAYLVKTDSNGNLKWQKTFGGIDYDYGYSVQQTADGGYIIAGSTVSFGAGGYDVYLIKTDPNGNLKWQKTFGGSDYDEGKSVQQTSDGGYIIAGTGLIKTDANGNIQWQKEKGVNGNSVQQTTEGGYIIAGSLSGDVYLIKTNPKGDTQWEKTFSFGGSYADYGYSVQQTTDGGYIIAGTTLKSYSSRDWDIYLIKLSSVCEWIGDLNCDGAVNFEDLGILTDQWLKPPSIPSADIAPAPTDGIVNFLDFAAMAHSSPRDLSLLSYWPLDEEKGTVAADIAGGHHGTCHGEPNWLPNAGQRGGAIQFDGVDDYISTPFILNPTTGAFSVFAWIKGGAPVLSQNE